MADDRNEKVEVECVVVHETDAAWLLDVGGDNNVWVPKSIGTLEHHVLTLPRWQAEARGLV